MPVYPVTYRRFEGAVRKRFRWWVVVKAELRILAQNRFFMGLLLLGYLHVFFRVLQVVAYDTLASDPKNIITQLLREVAALSVNSEMFFNFLRMQSPLLFVVLLFAGSGMICADFKNNLMEVYFSKPLTWRDYVLGKVMTLVVIGLGYTAVPGVFLVLLHNLLAPSIETLQATYWLPASIVLYSLAFVLPGTLGVLASSTLFSSQRYASIAIFMMLFGDLVIGGILPDALHKPQYAIVAFPLALNRVGEHLFQVRRPEFPVSWQWSAVFIAAVCVVALGIICRGVRRAEVAA